MFEVFRKSLQLTRSNDGYYDGPLWVEGNDDIFIILASVQPTPAEVLQTLDEGYRTKDTYTLYTDFECKTSKSEIKKPDFVTINNEKYIVVKVSQWQNNVVNHYQVVVVKEE